MPSTAQVITQTLQNHGVDTAYCVPGESFLPISDAFLEHPEMRLVICRHEGGAGLMAVAHARIRNEPGVCLVSRGPGAMNAAMALHVAHQDADPLIFLVGQAERRQLGRMALQEMNYARTFSDTAKLVIEVSEPSQAGEAIARAFHVAQAGTPGPVVVVLPEDLLYETCEAPALEPFPLPTSAPAPQDTAAALEMIGQAEKPLVISGGRLHGPQALADLTTFSERFGLPVATAHRRFHTFDSRHPNCAGRLPHRAPTASLTLMRESDLLIVLGERILPSMSQGFTFPRAPVPDQPLIHVWPDAQEIGRVCQPKLGLPCDPHEFIKAMLRADSGADISFERKAWLAKLNATHRDIMAWPGAADTEADDGVVFGHVTAAINEHLATDAIVTLDAGSFTSWVNRHIEFTQDNLMIGAAVGAMGPGVPSAVAAGICAPGRQVVAFAGDGGVLMTGNELATAMQYDVPIKLFIADNGAYGTIRVHQARAFPGRVTATGLRNPDFAAWAESFGARGFRIESQAEVAGVVAAAMSHEGPAVVSVKSSLNRLAAGVTLKEVEESGSSG